MRTSEQRWARDDLALTPADLNTTPTDLFAVELNSQNLSVFAVHDIENIFDLYFTFTNVLFDLADRLTLDIVFYPSQHVRANEADAIPIRQKWNAVVARRTCNSKTMLNIVLH